MAYTADASGLPPSPSDSSPDPLALSWSDVNEKPSGRARKAPLALRSTNSQKSAQTGQPSAEQLLQMSSPAKSMVMNTGRSGGASPWRIKVTVEAEPSSGASDGDDAVGYSSPSVRKVERTATKKVPLKQPDESSPVKCRGRPRKSDGPAAAKKRNGTPVRRSARAVCKSTDAADESSFVDVSTNQTAAAAKPQKKSDARAPKAQEPPKRRRGRPKKSIQPEEALFGLDVLDSTADDAHQDTPPDEEAQAPAGISVASAHVAQAPTVSQVRVRTGDTPQTTETAQRIRGRVPTPAGDLSCGDSTSDEPTVNTPSSSGGEGSTLDKHRQPDVEEPEPWHLDGVAEVDDDSDETGSDFDREASAMAGETTVLESEGFSMVSAAALPSTLAVGSTSKSARPTVGASLTSVEPSSLSVLSASRLSRPPDEVLSGQSPAQPVPSQPHSKRPTPSKLQPSPPVPMKEITPVVDSNPPSAPPPIEPLELNPSKPTAPQIAGVRRAGIALQGVLDPASFVQASGRAVGQPSSRHDDLLRGFGDGTRRVLQAGLSLGQQLAAETPESPQHSQGPPGQGPNQIISGALRGPGDLAKDKSVRFWDAKNWYQSLASTKRAADSAAQHHVPQPSVQQQSRLLTPAVPDHAITEPSALASNVQYPSLNTDSLRIQQITPARSDPEPMSWRATTPPMGLGSGDAFARPAAASYRSTGASGGKARKHRTNQELHVSSSLLSASSAAHQSPQLQDLLAGDGAAKPVRSKIPRTWRRTSGGNFSYSDEAKEDTSLASAKGKGRVEDVPIVEEPSTDEESEYSDDSGMFFQRNLPTVFDRRRKTSENDLGRLAQQTGNLMPVSSPTPAAKHSPNPFKDTPPQFATAQVSPSKGTPLRREVVDEAERSLVVGADESALPDSSPFHTRVDDTNGTAESTPSHVRQLHSEMSADAPESSGLRRIRDEVEAHANAYHPVTLTLPEIDEITEPSRSGLHHVSAGAMPSSPPQIFENSILAPRRSYPPLFGPEESSSDHSMGSESETAQSEPEQPTIVVTAPVEPARPQPGFFSRLTSSLWGTIAPAPAPTLPALPLHPLVAAMPFLPRVEPWTRSHYKALDALYQAHKDDATLFSPNSTPLNAALLAQFPHASRYVGASYAKWGYATTMNASLVVLAAAFVPLLACADIAACERATGRTIDVGSCCPRDPGLPIDEAEVVKRLATIVMGEDLRRDEKMGKPIHRVGNLCIIWGDESGF